MATIDEREYWERRDAQFAAETEAAKAYRNSPAGRLAAAERKVRALRAGRTDSGLYTEAEIAEAETAYRTLRDEIEGNERARFAAEWTREVTMARRAEWNARVKGGEFNRNGRIFPPLIVQAEREHGWTFNDLKLAVQQHGL